jgi:hypothetical protein
MEDCECKPKEPDKQGCLTIELSGKFAVAFPMPHIPWPSNPWVPFWTGYSLGIGLTVAICNRGLICFGTKQGIGDSIGIGGAVSGGPNVGWTSLPSDPSEAEGSESESIEGNFAVGKGAMYGMGIEWDDDDGWLESLPEPHPHLHPPAVHPHIPKKGASGSIGYGAGIILSATKWKTKWRFCFSLNPRRPCGTMPGFKSVFDPLPKDEPRLDQDALNRISSGNTKAPWDQ